MFLIDTGKLVGTFEAAILTTRTANDLDVQLNNWLNDHAGCVTLISLQYQIDSAPVNSLFDERFTCLIVFIANPVTDPDATSNT